MKKLILAVASLFAFSTPAISETPAETELADDVPSSQEPSGIEELDEDYYGNRSGRIGSEVSEQGIRGRFTSGMIGEPERGPDSNMQSLDELMSPAGEPVTSHRVPSLGEAPYEELDKSHKPHM